MSLWCFLWFIFSLFFYAFRFCREKESYCTLYLRLLYIFAAVQNNITKGMNKTGFTKVAFIVGLLLGIAVFI